MSTLKLEHVALLSKYCSCLQLLSTCQGSHSTQGLSQHSTGVTQYTRLISPLTRDHSVHRACLSTHQESISTQGLSQHSPDVIQYTGLISTLTRDHTVHRFISALTKGNSFHEIHPSTHQGLHSTKGISQHLPAYNLQSLFTHPHSKLYPLHTDGSVQHTFCI